MGSFDYQFRLLKNRIAKYKYIIFLPFIIILSIIYYIFFREIRNINIYGTYLSNNKTDISYDFYLRSKQNIINFDVYMSLDFTLESANFKEKQKYLDFLKNYQISTSFSCSEKKECQYKGQFKDINKDLIGAINFYLKENILLQKQQKEEKERMDRIAEQEKEKNELNPNIPNQQNSENFGENLGKNELNPNDPNFNNGNGSGTIKESNNTKDPNIPIPDYQQVDPNTKKIVSPIPGLGGNSNIMQNLTIKNGGNNNGGGITAMNQSISGSSTDINNILKELDPNERPPIVDCSKKEFYYDYKCYKTPNMKITINGLKINYGLMLSNSKYEKYQKNIKFDTPSYINIKN